MEVLTVQILMSRGIRSQVPVTVSYIHTTPSLPVEIQTGICRASYFTVNTNNNNTTANTNTMGSSEAPQTPVPMSASHLCSSPVSYTSRSRRSPSPTPSLTDCSTRRTSSLPWPETPDSQTSLDSLGPSPSSPATPMLDCLPSPSLSTIPSPTPYWARTPSGASSHTISPARSPSWAPSTPTPRPVLPASAPQQFQPRTTFSSVVAARAPRIENEHLQAAAAVAFSAVAFLFEPEPQRPRSTFESVAAERLRRNAAVNTQAEHTSSSSSSVAVATAAPSPAAAAAAAVNAASPIGQPVPAPLGRMLLPTPACPTFTGYVLWQTAAEPPELVHPRPQRGLGAEVEQLEAIAERMGTRRACGDEYWGRG